VESKIIKLEIEFDSPVSATTRQWLEVDIKSFLQYKWKTYETVVNKEGIQVRLIEE